jgi:hypothetical protein
MTIAGHVAGPRSLRGRTPLAGWAIRASPSNPALRILLRALGFARDALTCLASNHPWCGAPVRPSLAGRYSRHPWRSPFGPPSAFGRAPARLVVDARSAPGR